MCHFWVFLGEFRDSRIQTSGFESRIHESTSKRFESHESNGKLSTAVGNGYNTVRLNKMYVNLRILTYMIKWDVL